MRLNNKGFAISGILYSMFILVITLMFLVLGILAGRRTTLNKIGQEAASSIEKRTVYKVTCTNINWNQSKLYSFNLFDKEQEVELEEGYYLIQAWGGAGAKSNDGNGGKGAYSSTIYQATKKTKIYLNIGAGGDSITNLGTLNAYNGGGAGSGMSGTGGGATSVATHKGELKDLSSHKDKIILVAAGGGGAGKGDGGAGGTLYNGLDGEGSGNGPGMGATQTSGGTGGVDNDTSKSGSTGAFGLGGNAGVGAQNKTQGGGGGGGYYGGGGAAASDTNNGGGGGGLSYINEDFLAFTLSILKNGGIFASHSKYKEYVGVGIDGNSDMPDTHWSTNASILTQEKVGNNSSGYVRITPLVCSE